MYKPTATSARPSIWVTLFMSTWQFSDSWTQTVNPSPQPPTFTQGAVSGYPRSGVTTTGPVKSSQLPVWSNQPLKNVTGTPAPDPACT